MREQVAYNYVYRWAGKIIPTLLNLDFPDAEAFSRYAADPAHQAPLLEPLDQLGGGHLAEPGQLAELGAGERASGEQQLQRRAVVERAQQPRRARKAGGGHNYVP